MADVRVFGGRRTNAQLVVDLARLGYLPSDGDESPVLDPTYGRGRWWTDFRPASLTCTDLNPAWSPHAAAGLDFRPGRNELLPESFWAVTVDGPYKLNGTSTGKGGASSDESYGVSARATWRERHQLIEDMIAEAERVTMPGGIVIVKCKNQVNSGAVKWQTRWFADSAEEIVRDDQQQLTLIDMLAVESYIPQPKNRTRKGKGDEEERVNSRQHHARSDHSMALVFRKRKSRRKRRQ